MSQDRFVIQIKSQLGMAISRLRILQNNYSAQAKSECRRVATMIEEGKIARAKIRVENVIQLNLSTRFYELLERYCEILHARCMLMSLAPQRRQFLFSKSVSANPPPSSSSSKNAQMNVPEPAIAEAVSTLLYVARDSGVKELGAIAFLLQSRFSSDYIKAAILDEDFRTASGAASASTTSAPRGDSESAADLSSPEITSRCSPRVKKALEDMVKIPSPELVDLYLGEIAEEYDLDLAPEAIGEGGSGDEDGQIKHMLPGKTKKAAQIANLPVPPGAKANQESSTRTDDERRKGKISAKEENDSSEGDEVEDADDGEGDGHHLVSREEKDYSTEPEDPPPYRDDNSVDQSSLSEAELDRQGESQLNQDDRSQKGTSIDTDKTNTSTTTFNANGTGQTNSHSTSAEISDLSEKEIQKAIDALARDLAAFPSVPPSPVREPHTSGEMNEMRDVDAGAHSEANVDMEEEEPIDPEALLHSGIEAESVFKISDPESMFPSVPSEKVVVPSRAGEADGSQEEGRTQTQAREEEEEEAGTKQDGEPENHGEDHRDGVNEGKGATTKVSEPDTLLPNEDSLDVIASRIRAMEFNRKVVEHRNGESSNDTNNDDEDGDGNKDSTVSAPAPVPARATPPPGPTLASSSTPNSKPAPSPSHRKSAFSTSTPTGRPAPRNSLNTAAPPASRSISHRPTNSRSALFPYSHPSTSTSSTSAPVPGASTSATFSSSSRTVRTGSNAGPGSGTKSSATPTPTTTPTAQHSKHQTSSPVPNRSSVLTKGSGSGPGSTGTALATSAAAKRPGSRQGPPSTGGAGTGARSGLGSATAAGHSRASGGGSAGSGGAGTPSKSSVRKGG